MSDREATYEEHRSEGTKQLVKARESLKSLGRFPPLFTTAIRALMADATAGYPSPRPATHYLVGRLMRSPTMKAMVYHASLTFHNDRISNCAYLSSADLVRLYAPMDLSVLVALLFLYKKVRRLGNYSQNDEWQALVSRIQLRADLSMHLGYAIPGISPAFALMANCFPLLGEAFLLAKHPVEYEAYRKHLVRNCVERDQSYEEKCWGYTSVELAANLLQMVGLGVGMTRDLVLGTGSYTPDEKDDPNAFRVAIAVKWVECLQTTGAAPKEKISGSFYPLEKALYKLLYEVNELRERGSRFNWLERGKNDISIQSTPQLFQEVLAEMQKPEQVQKFITDNLPDELLGELSNEDLKALTDSNAVDSSISEEPDGDDDV